MFDTHNGCIVLACGKARNNNFYLVAIFKFLSKSKNFIIYDHVYSTVT